MIKIQGDLCHSLLTKKIQPKLAFNDGMDFLAWKNEVREKLLELVGIDRIAENACPLGFR